ncbi:Flp family type IVb pilin [Noviherbaspirillum saxi]|nr:Flp family type IVb pilin [Noviherbaspirillum saxi]
MMEMIKKFIRDEEGATAIEYGLLAGLISVVIITAVTNVGVELDRIFDLIDTELAKAVLGGGA